jgi:hypothetical protein
MTVWLRLEEILVPSSAHFGQYIHLCTRSRLDYLLCHLRAFSFSALQRSNTLYSLSYSARMVARWDCQHFLGRI